MTFGIIHRYGVIQQGLVCSLDICIVGVSKYKFHVNYFAKHVF